MLQGDLPPCSHVAPALQRFGAAAQASADAIFLIDAGRMALVDVNGAACEMHGHSRPALLATAPEVLFSAPRHELDAAWRALIAGDLSGDTFETRLRRADASGVPVEVRQRALRVSGAWLIVMVARDVSARKEVECALQRQVAQHDLLARFGHFALENPPLHDLMSQAIEVVQQGLNVRLCRLLETGHDDRTLIQVAGAGWCESWLREPIFDAVAETEDRFALGARESIVVADFEAEMRFKCSPILHAHGVRSAVEVLICGAGGAYGVIGAYAREAGQFGVASANFVQSVSNTLAAAIERKNAEDRLTYIAQFDALTRLPNRSLYLERLGLTLIESGRDKLPVAVLFVDIDRFKNVNDTFGHQRGDAVLVELAARVRGQVRDVDTVARYGGEEVVVVLPETDEAGAVRAAERICDVVRRRCFGEPGQVPVDVTVSVGVAVFPMHGATAGALLRRADEALYDAKRAGRDTWRMAPH